MTVFLLILRSFCFFSCMTAMTIPQGAKCIKYFADSGFAVVAGIPVIYILDFTNQICSAAAS